jgi:anti-anti-sigma factor
MELTCHALDGDPTLVGVSGHVTQPAGFPESDPLVDLLGHETYRRRLLLDLSGVDSIDSSGVSWLLTCHRRFRAEGGALVLHSLSPFVRDVLKILNMQLVLNIAENRAAGELLSEAT